MKDKHTQPWVPMYADKWLFGSTRLELDPGERSVFVDLIMMGSKDNGYIRANETIPYPPKQLAAFLNISEELLQSTISKCLQYGKLNEISAGMWRIASWDNFRLSKSYKSELETGKKSVPGIQRTESSLQRTESSPIIEENRVEEKRIEESRTFKPPTLDEVYAYCKERNNGINPSKFIDHYASTGWKRGNTKIKDWKACIRTWEGRDNPKPASPPISNWEQEQLERVTREHLERQRGAK